MKHMTEFAIEVLVALYPCGTELSAIERMAEAFAPKAWQSRNVGGMWWLVLSHAGLLEGEQGLPGPVRYRLTDEGFAHVAFTRKLG